MILFRFSVSLVSYFVQFLDDQICHLFTKRGSASEARLHTATSFGSVYSMISVQRLELLMVPRFCWLDLRLAESLYSR